VRPPAPASAAGPSSAPVPVPAPDTIPPTAEYPIDLATALRLAEVENPTIAAARAAIMEALAVPTQARGLLLPSLNPRTNPAPPQRRPELSPAHWQPPALLRPDPQPPRTVALRGRRCAHAGRRVDRHPGGERLQPAHRRLVRAAGGAPARDFRIVRGAGHLQ